MRILIVIAVLLLIFAAVGWIQFSSPDGDPTIRVDADKVRQDTSTIVEKSKQAADSAAKSIDRASEQIDARIDRGPSETDQPSPDVQVTVPE